MKNTIIFLFSILLFSCASKQDARVINDYVNWELDPKKYDTLFVKIEPTKKAFTLKLYEEAFLVKDSKNDHRYLWLIPSNFNDWPLNLSDIQAAKKDTINKNWTADELGRNYKYARADELKDRNFKIKHVSEKRYVLYISRPLYNAKKNKAIFHFTAGQIVFGGSPFNRGVMMMEKKNGKWVKTGYLWEEYYE